MTKKMSKKMSKAIPECPSELKQMRSVIMSALEQLHVTYVKIEWSGSGDSGQIDSITARDVKQDVEVDLEKTQVKITKTVTESIRKPNGNGYLNVKKTVEEEVSVEKAIETLVEEWWELSGQGGWYNDDGGYGSGLIDVKAGTIKLEHYNNVVESVLGAEAII